MRAAAEVIAEQGMAGLSFRAIAEKLGGSTTLVTHYYSSRKELLDDFAVRLVSGWREDLKGYQGDVEDPYEKLMLLLEWLLPLDEEDLIGERCRINLLADQLTGDEHQRIFDHWERLVRKLLREHVRELVPEDRVEQTVKSLRALTNGLALSAVEHPATWTRAQQLAVLNDVVSGLGLAPVSRSTADGNRRSKGPASNGGRRPAAKAADRA
jgi:AcrR family transcriptional regulator